MGGPKLEGVSSETSVSTPMDHSPNQPLSASGSPNAGSPGSVQRRSVDMLLRALSDERAQREHSHTRMREEQALRHKTEEQVAKLQTQLKEAKREALPSTRLMELMDRLLD